MKTAFAIFLALAIFASAFRFGLWTTADRTGVSLSIYPEDASYIRSGDDGIPSQARNSDFEDSSDWFFCTTNSSGDQRCNQYQFNAK